MRERQRTTLLIVVIVVAIAGLVVLFVAAPWHKASAPPDGTVLRDGTPFEGTWSRPATADPTVFTAPNGTALPVAPGAVRIMLVPK